MSMPFRFVVVTGASRGLGLEFTRQLLGAGATVAALARDPEASTLVSLQTANAERLLRVACDVGLDQSVADAVMRIGQVAKQVDLLINNAGIMGSETEDVENLDIEAALEVMNINTFGALRVTRALLPLLAASRRAVVANITSLAGSLGDNTLAVTGLLMSKAALQHGDPQLPRIGGGLHYGVALHPVAKTDMAAKRPLAAGDSISGMLANTARFIPSKAAFLRHDTNAPW